MAGSHEGRKANPALDLKLIDCGERPRCEPVSASCSSCKLFMFTVCRQFTVWLWSISLTLLNIAGHTFSTQCVCGGWGQGNHPSTKPV